MMAESKSFYFLSKPVPPETKDETKSAVTEISRYSGLEMDSHSEVDSSFSSWLSHLFAPKGYQTVREEKKRKVPTKIEPKVFFANERTFLAWLHMAVTLSSIAIAIVAFAEANDFSQIYGLILMPVAIAFCAYSLYMYMKRSSMIKRREPGPYEDKVGPIVLSSILGLAIVINFSVNLYDISTEHK